MSRPQIFVAGIRVIATRRAGRLDRALPALRHHRVRPRAGHRSHPTVAAHRIGWRARRIRRMVIGRVCPGLGHRVWPASRFCRVMRGPTHCPRCALADLVRLGARDRAWSAVRRPGRVSVRTLPRVHRGLAARHVRSRPSGVLLPERARPRGRHGSCCGLRTARDRRSPRDDAAHTGLGVCGIRQVGAAATIGGVGCGGVRRRGREVAGSSRVISNTLAGRGPLAGRRGFDSLDRRGLRSRPWRHRAGFAKIIRRGDAGGQRRRRRYGGPSGRWRRPRRVIRFRRSADGRSCVGRQGRFPGPAHEPVARRVTLRTISRSRRGRHSRHTGAATRGAWL